jgi:hypothetical protein
MADFIAPQLLNDGVATEPADDSALASRVVQLVLRSLRNSDEELTEQRLAEVVAKYIGAVRQVQTLEQQHTEMRQFFSPKVVETLASCGAATAAGAGERAVLRCARLLAQGRAIER